MLCYKVTNQNISSAFIFMTPLYRNRLLEKRSRSRPLSAVHRFIRIYVHKYYIRTTGAVVSNQKLSSVLFFLLLSSKFYFAFRSSTKLLGWLVIRSRDIKNCVKLITGQRIIFFFFFWIGGGEREVEGGQLITKQNTNITGGGERGGRSGRARKGGGGERGGIRAIIRDAALNRII